MKKIGQGEPESQSKDIKENNLRMLKELFPEAFSEGYLDPKILVELLPNGAIDEMEEKYGLNWHGKRQARQIALSPSSGTLRPCPAESVNWDTTENIMIEGDNLEVLKLLQKSYACKVKLIYIDPPYNTGKDFVYPDNFQDNIKNYLELTNQIGEGGKRLSSNTEASGRFHTDWLNMMYPRLKLARNLLREDGAIFISADDGEVANLRLVLNDIFGEENFVAQFVWKARQFTDARAGTNVSTDHEYILAYAKDAGFTLRGVGRDETKFTNPDGDTRGPWMSRSILGLATRDQRPNLHYEIVEPITGRIFPPNPSTGWRYSRDKMQCLIEEKSILFPVKDDGRPREKKFRKDMMADFIAYRSIIDGVHTANGTEEIRTLFGADVFDFPKPTELLRQLVEQVVDSNDIALDFFAGSGTTAHAVWLQNMNAQDLRRWILVQLPEPLDPTNRDQKAAVDFCDSLSKPRNIAELTKERLRLASKELLAKNPLFAGDLGFRVFKLDSSNISAWDPDRTGLDEALLSSIEHIKSDRGEEDVLYELLLRLGLDLCVPIERKTISGKLVHNIGAGALFVCLSSNVSSVDMEMLALGIVEWHRELNPPGESSIVFRDSSFSDDVTKTNLTAILQQHGLENVRSL